MTQYDNTNSGGIWKNENKETDNHPDFKGQLNVDGKEYWVSAWKRDPQGNPKAPALRFSVKPKEPAQSQGVESARQAAQQPSGQQGAPQGASGGHPDMDDDVPFASFMRHMEHCI